MHILLSVLQILVGLHTLIGALWKFTNSAQAIPSLSMISSEVWVALSIFEILCALALVMPLFRRSLSKLVIVGAAGILIEMLTFCGLHFYSGVSDMGPVVYWFVVAGLCEFIIIGRTKLKPL